MFQSARLKLTAWYLAIIMAVSIAFSAVIFVGSTSEFDRALRMQKYHLEHPEFQLRIIPGNRVQIAPAPIPEAPDKSVIQDAELRLLQRLLGVNGVILLISALAGYFLAGRTLRPIQRMVDDQNRFITDASHELNTPLTSLRTGIEVNLRDKKLTLAKAREVLKSNLEEVEALQLLSTDLIKLTQYRQVNGNLPFEKVSIEKIVTDAINKVKILAENKHVVLSVKVPNVFILGEERSLTETFVVLLDNAIKYSEKKTEVSVIGKKSDNKVEIQVQDHGIGIDKNDLPHIFDRFYRADKSRTKQHIPGYGLGLSIAKRVVEVHKGSIVAASVVGQGATFTITLPLYKGKS